MQDLILIHAPSVYDFRKRKLNLGPISDVVPSTPIFEMYPIGYVSLISKLVKMGYSVRLINLALLMLLHKNFKVEKAIGKADSHLYGLDLHWLPTVHGTIELSKIIKELHPNRKIVIGGLSATYYAKELMQKYPHIDFILKGDTTEPYMPMLIDAVEGSESYSSIPNLVWRKGGRIIENACEHPESHIDEVFIDYATFSKNVIRNLGIEESIPYKSWFSAPAGMTIIQKGCRYNCAFCGGSAYAYRNFYCRNRMSLRNPDRIIEELKLLQEYTGSPAFIAGDVHDAGHAFEEKLLTGIKKEGIDLPILFEIFRPADKGFFELLSKNINEYAIEISPESGSEEVRRAANKPYSNAALEETISLALSHNAKKMDIFFSIGLPMQDKGIVERDERYAKKLEVQYGSKLHTFASPLAPFIDPGSLAFEKPLQYGYTIHASSLQDHYNLLDSQNNWNSIFNYETKWLTRDDIAFYSIKSALHLSYEGLSDTEKAKVDERIRQIIRGELSDASLLPIVYKKDELLWSKKVYSKALFPFMLNMYNSMKKLLPSLKQ